MTPQEKDLITTLLARLKSAQSQPKDPEAEALIRQALAEQPDAPYFLVQTVLIQDFSLHNAQNRIAALEKEVAEAHAPKPATSFLGGLFGRSEPAAPASSGSVPPSGPWAQGPTASPQASASPPPNQGYAHPGYPQGAYAPPPAGPFSGGMGGGGFLRSAAATAAGVAGGALLFEGIRSMFGPHEVGLGGGLGAGLGGGLGGIGAATPGLSETVINNYYGGDPGAGGGTDFAGSSFDPGTGQDYGSQDPDPGFDPGTGTDQDSDSGSDYDTGAGDYDSGSDFDPGDGGDDFSC